MAEDCYCHQLHQSDHVYETVIHLLIVLYVCQFLEYLKRLQVLIHQHHLDKK